LAARQAAADSKGAGGDGLPKLPQGWGYQATADGGAMAAPVPGTPDWSKGVAGLEGLNGAYDRIGTLLDLFQGKEQTTKGGRIERMGGQGSELYGETAARYSMMRSAIMSDVGKLHDLGVLQIGDVERISND